MRYLVTVHDDRAQPPEMTKIVLDSVAAAMNQMTESLVDVQLIEPGSDLALAIERHEFER